MPSNNAAPEIKDPNDENDRIPSAPVPIYFDFTGRRHPEVLSCLFCPESTLPSRRPGAGKTLRARRAAPREEADFEINRWNSGIMVRL